MIQFECERRDVSRAMNYFKNTHPSKMTTVQVAKYLGYNCSFIYMVGSAVSILDPYILQLITDRLISKRWGGVYSYHIQYDHPQDVVDESNTITFQQYLANITEKQENTPEINYSMQYPVTMTPLQ